MRDGLALGVKQEFALPDVQHATGFAALEGKEEGGKRIVVGKGERKGEEG